MRHENQLANATPTSVQTQANLWTILNLRQYQAMAAPSWVIKFFDRATSPLIAISSSTNAAPIVLTVATGHGVVSGDVVVVAGHTVNTNANGVWATTVTATTITLLGSTGNGIGGATGNVLAQPQFSFLSPPGDLGRDQVQNNWRVQSPYAGWKFLNGLWYCANSVWGSQSGPTVGQEPYIVIETQPIGQGL